MALWVEGAVALSRRSVGILNLKAIGNVGAKSGLRRDVEVCGSAW